MTGDPSWAVQQAIFDALTGAAALAALLGDGAAGVYDDVPENATFPYVTIGETFLSPFDTKPRSASSTSSCCISGRATKARRNASRS